MFCITLSKPFVYSFLVKLSLFSIIEWGGRLFFEKTGFLSKLFKEPLIHRQERRLLMPFCKKENLADLSRKYGIPYPTLYWWVRAGKIVLPKDEELLGQL